MTELLVRILLIVLGGVIAWLAMSNNGLAPAGQRPRPKARYRFVRSDDNSDDFGDTQETRANGNSADGGATLSARQFAVSCRRAQRIQAFESRFRSAIPAYVLIPSFEWDERFHQLFDKGCGITRGDVALRYNHLGQRYGLFVPHAVLPLCIVDFYLAPYDLIRFPPSCLHDDDLPIVSFGDRDPVDDVAVQEAVAAALGRYRVPSFVQAAAE
jgi:hypothetical protein